MFTLEDFKVGQTDEFGDYLITKEEIIEFARKYDPQLFHTDEEYAKKFHFGDLIASGWMTCSVMMRMFCDHFLNNSAGAGAPGVDELRWKKPVYAGDRLHCKTEVLDVIPSKSRPYLGTVKTKVEVINQKDEIVLSLITIAMFLKREAAEKAQTEGLARLHG
ncbi:MaoC family dehydratase [Emcibacter nanhaiensis]|uniref:MaoC family dehydratase n=1 Tax=Emcibacter nanhaiensis TaxID=1505037 RepID=A0A501PHF3_9PROT|nr:MaoC family dehydratase [Emcibacter nanhaiensis]